ncbi:MAG: iron ABC transporter permease, partial [Lachnospiraceae bacterium]|nr:iron ABC transporter permease [Lachnospiraceae bacterium]
LGLNVTSMRLILLVLSSVLSGCVVSYAGLLSFVGLIVPHICRSLFGNDARYLLPCSALLGACFVLLCDILGRVLFAPFELPAGVLLSFIGGPFFLYLLFIKKGGRRVNA